ncbi:MAG: MarR family transcriptional regulator [Actinomycetota bacterium]|nr:MarR family transcriptional regulator [Actinomycetota bacterium]
MAGDGFDPLEEARRQWLAHDLAEPLAMTVATSVIHAHQVVSTAIDRALRPLGLTFARYEVLMLLSFSRAGALPMNKVADRLLVSAAGVTKLVDKLAADGLVQRVPNPTDRRGTLVELTPQGRRLARRATRMAGDVRFGADLPDHELEQLVALLRRLRGGGEQVTSSEINR